MQATLTPYKHQTEAVQFLMDRNGTGAIFADPGLGKTAISLFTFTRLRNFFPELKMLVVCPLSLIEAAWVEDTQKFTDYKPHNLREKCRDFDAVDIFIVNYEMLITKKMEGLIHGILTQYRCMGVLDESSRMKSYKARTTKKLHELSGLFKHKVILSATPAPNCPTELWPQIHFVSPGVLPHNFFHFRNRFFHYARGGEVLPRGAMISKSAAQEFFKKGFKLSLTEENHKQILSMIEPVCFRARKEDCLDLPDQVDELRYVEMTPAQSKAYLQMKKDAITEFANQHIVAQVALTKILKLRQILSGFAFTASGETVQIEGTCPKFRELEYLLEEIGDRQVIIWCTFQKEVRDIAAHLGGKACTLYGETKDKEASIAAFKQGECQYLIAHPRSAGHGLTFVNASYQIFYSLDYSWECYYQAKARIHRIGQTQKCTYFHLLHKGAIDATILKVLQRKGEAMEILTEVLS